MYRLFNKKAQSSVEFLVIFAVALVIFLALFTYSSTYLTSQTKDTSQKTTQYYLDTLTKASNEVYFQGVGASKKIYFVVPEGVDGNSTGVSLNTAFMTVYGSDIWSKSDVNLIGQLPTSTGGHYLYLRTYPNYVLISPSIVVVNKEVLYELMGKNALVNDPISITNYSDESVNVKIYLTWDNPLVTITLDDDPFLLSQTETKTISIDFNTEQHASGLYFGNLRFEVDFNTFEDINIDVPITVDVVSGHGAEIASCLSINPPKRVISVYKGDTIGYTFTICNICIDDQNNIKFTTDNLDLNILTNPIADIATIGSAECVQKEILAHPSLAYNAGTYSGILNLTADSDETASIDLNIVVMPYKWELIAYEYFETTSFCGGSGWIDCWTKNSQTSIGNTYNPVSLPYHAQLLKGASMNRFYTFYGVFKPKIEFKAKIVGFIPNDEAYFKVSTTYFFWSTLKTFTVTDSTATYNKYVFDFSNYTNAPLFWIAFTRNSNNNQLAGIYIDDIEIFRTVPA